MDSQSSGRDVRWRVGPIVIILAEDWRFLGGVFTACVAIGAALLLPFSMPSIWVALSTALFLGVFGMTASVLFWSLARIRTCPDCGGPMWRLPRPAKGRYLVQCRDCGKSAGTDVCVNAPDRTSVDEEHLGEEILSEGAVPPETRPKQLPLTGGNAWAVKWGPWLGSAIFVVGLPLMGLIGWARGDVTGPEALITTLALVSVVSFLVVPWTSLSTSTASRPPPVRGRRSRWHIGQVIIVPGEDWLYLFFVGGGIVMVAASIVLGTMGLWPMWSMIIFVPAGFAFGAVPLAGLWCTAKIRTCPKCGAEMWREVQKNYGPHYVVCTACGKRKSTGVTSGLE